MSFINAGVSDANGEPFASKKALKEAVKASPESVHAFSTSPLGVSFHDCIIELPVGDELTIAGPNPYNDRKWFANIKWKNGKLIVS